LPHAFNEIFFRLGQNLISFSEFSKRN